MGELSVETPRARTTASLQSLTISLRLHHCEAMVVAHEKTARLLADAVPLNLSCGSLGIRSSLSAAQLEATFPAPYGD